MEHTHILYISKKRVNKKIYLDIEEVHWIVVIMEQTNQKKKPGKKIRIQTINKNLVPMVLYTKKKKKLSTKYRVYIGSGNVYFHSIYKKNISHRYYKTRSQKLLQR